MSDERSPRDIAAEHGSIKKAYWETRRRGQHHHQAFLAAVRTYRKCHPEVPKPAAAHAVTQMMRAVEGPKAA